MDRMIRCLTKSGKLMACAVDSTYMVATAQQIHHTSPTATAALGRLLTGTSMMGAMLKDKGANLQVKMNGGGSLGDAVAIADNNGNCRGYVSHPEADLPIRADGKLDVGGLVGHDGMVTVMRDDNAHTPYTGQVKLVSGEVAEDLATYFAVSEQIPTVCALGVLENKENAQQLLAGGLFVQVMPGATKEELDQLEKNAAALPAVTEMLAQGLTIEEMCGKILQGMPFEKLDEYKVSYACDCSKERVERAFSSLRPADIRTLADDESGFAEATCNYCGRKYRFTSAELRALADAVEKSQKNL
ncbi:MULTISPECIES: Hsp33 family molecular chaperone HslO [Caproicibacterium]|uniref:33 kDa chaperonin n=1 Tax=Caproicibacterium argilliputei TaxID=3030016 RepID=A0AA97D7M8_9FIRM|nr:Hsp33 family molecular chaperone HslO [Caproicibacterium argilliputei]WOC31012.1 Hsp33 family molecular chaperone HslO [Caproicibacterium argilliputei]